ncbi:hypothetical protein NC651_017391 [Populus alba x Populus x berolinensis]|nr:hypothetical protein NC651_017391 [Populus alba x Populus x berolinensis]
MFINSEKSMKQGRIAGNSSFSFVPSSSLSQIKDVECWDVQEVAQSRDTLLDKERNEAEELAGRVETLESALREKESQLNMLEGVEGLGHPSNPASEIVEVKPVFSSSTSVPGFKSLTTSRIAPKFTRPVSDMIDGLW